MIAATFAAALALAPVALPGPTTVSAYHGTIAYSRLDPGTHRWSLMLRTGDVETPAKVTPRDVPFDVDLGPDARGATVAVYSRCRREPDVSAGDGAIAYPSRASGCRVHLYDPAAGSERAIAGAAGYLPAIWKHTLVFARGARDAALYARVSGVTRRLGEGGRRFCRTGGRECETGAGIAYTGVDVAGTRVAVAREITGIYDAPATQMVLTGIGHRPVVVEARANGVSFRAMRFPALDAGRLYYAETCAGDPASCLQQFRRYTIATGRLASARSPSLYLTGFAQSGRDAYFVRAQADWGETFEGVCQGFEPGSATTCTLGQEQPRYRTATASSPRTPVSSSRAQPVTSPTRSRTSAGRSEPSSDGARSSVSPPAAPAGGGVTGARAAARRSAPGSVLKTTTRP